MVAAVAWATVQAMGVDVLDITVVHPPLEAAITQRRARALTEADGRTAGRGMVGFHAVTPAHV